MVVSNIFYFHPYLGKIPILTNIFQMGWNHQPVVTCYMMLHKYCSKGLKWPTKKDSVKLHHFKQELFALPALLDWVDCSRLVNCSYKHFSTIQIDCGSFRHHFLETLVCKLLVFPLGMDLEGTFFLNIAKQGLWNHLFLFPPWFVISWYLVTWKFAGTLSLKKSHTATRFSQMGKLFHCKK